VLCRFVLAAPLPAALSAQGAPVAPLEISTVDLSPGRSFPVQSPVAVSRVTVANPEVADVVVVGERDVIVNAKAAGETDVILIGAGQFRRQYRVRVHTASDRRQIVLGVKIAEVRRDALTQVGVSGLYRGTQARAGTSTFRTDNAFDRSTGAINLEGTRFLSVLTDFGTRDLLALIEAEATRGRARVLAEPNLMAADRDSATFLSGGEIPIPIAQPGVGGQVFVTVQFREFGVRLTFVPEILNDSIVKLRVRPEVSSLDFGNALLLSGFRIPALRTRRVESTVDVRRDRSLVISGLFNDEREQVRSGIPLLMNIPILGNLFSSTRWQRNETELLIVVTPTVLDPLRPRAQDAIRVQPDTALPAREVIERRLVPSTAPTAPPRRP
jgi:Flp pilus assembly secretin CpaC